MISATLYFTIQGEAKTTAEDWQFDTGSLINRIGFLKEAPKKKPCGIVLCRTFLGFYVFRFKKIVSQGEGMTIAST